MNEHREALLRTRVEKMIANLRLRSDILAEIKTRPLSRQFALLQIIEAGGKLIEAKTSRTLQ